MNNNMENKSAIYTKEERMLLLQLKLKQALDEKNDEAILYYSKLLDMYKNMPTSSNEEIAKLFLNRK